MKESPTGDEISIEEATFTLKIRGWIVIWAEKLGEYIVLAKRAHRFKKNEPDMNAIAAVYTMEEMDALKGLGDEAVKVLHEAKKLFKGTISKPKKKRKYKILKAK